MSELKKAEEFVAEEFVKAHDSVHSVILWLVSEVHRILDIVEGIKSVEEDNVQAASDKPESSESATQLTLDPPQQ